MNQDLQQETELKRYLLGELTLEEQALIEQRLFLDSDYAQLAQAVEDDLIDDYVRDDLTAIERKKFETHFLLQRPENSEDLRIAQALERYLTFEGITNPAVVTIHRDQHAILSAQPRHKPAVWFALAAAILIVLSIVTWIAIRSSKPANNPQQAQEQQPGPTGPDRQQQPGPSLPINGSNSRRDDTVERRDDPNKKRNEREDRRPEQQPMPPTFPAVTLLPGGGSRGGGQIKEVVIASEQKSVSLKLLLSTTKDYERYHLELMGRQRRVHAQILSSQIDEESGRPIIFITLPTNLLTQRRYEIKLRGITADGRYDQLDSYLFTVRKE
jgi:hypothetical protein